MADKAEHTPLRILMTTDTVGGVWSYSVALCKALLPFDVRFYLITTGAPLQPQQKEEVAQLKNVTVYETNFLLEWMEAPWQSIDASASWLLQAEKELQPDLIHINGYVYGSLPWNAPVIVVAHSDVWSWWHSVKGAPPPSAWNEYYQRVRAGLQDADFVIAPSRWMLKAIRDIYAITTAGNVIYNGRSAEDFFPAKKERSVFSMGRIWDEAKNIKLLIEAAAHIPYPVKIAGDNSFANNIFSTEGTNIIYLGKLSEPEVAAQLAAASVYVLPAMYEPFGLSVLEAALSGCALVLGNIDSLKEIWNDNAIYVDTADAAALADAVNGLMQNEEARLHYAQKAMAQAKKYTTSEMAKQYLQLYRGLLQPEKIVLQQNA